MPSSINSTAPAYAQNGDRSLANDSADFFLLDFFFFAIYFAYYTLLIAYGLALFFGDYEWVRLPELHER